MTSIDSNATPKEKTAKPCAVIGAGIAGLATAVRLAAKGHAVTVYEASAYPGGKLAEIRAGAYRFDAGPSLFTMPFYVDALFELAGKSPREYFNYRKLSLLCKYFYEDGTIIRAFDDHRALAEEIASKCEVSAQSILRYLDKSQRKYDLTAEVFLHRSLHKLGNYFTKSTWKGISHAHELDIFRTLHQVNESYFQDPRLVQFFDRYATYNGSDPYKTSGIMQIVPHLEYGFGAYFPEGGMYAITESIYRLALDVGVRFHFNTPVRQITVQGGKVQGVMVPTPEGDTQTIPYEVVVSNADMVSTYQKLLPDQKAPKRLLRQPKSSSALIFYWGIKKTFPELELHNILFSKSYQKEFHHLSEQKTIYEDPTVYLNISAKEQAEDAPPGGENWFTMINAPHNVGQDWDALIRESRENIIKKINRMLKTDIRPYIEVEEMLDPRLLETRTSSSQGALYGNSSNNRMAAFLRHANFSSRIQNLYFCGGSVHPGGGLPLCLLSAKITSEMI